MLIKDHTTYSDFFRLMATHHKAIHHTNSRQAFARMNLSAHPVLAREDIKEFLESMRNRLNFPALLLNTFTSKPSATDSHDAKRLIIQGEFFILNRYPISDFNRLEEVFQETEVIGKDIIAFLGEYYSEHPFEGTFEWDEAMIEPISNISIDSLGGKKFYFTISIPHEVAFHFNDEAFDDELFSI